MADETWASYYSPLPKMTHEPLFFVPWGPFRRFRKYENRIANKETIEELRSEFPQATFVYSTSYFQDAFYREHYYEVIYDRETLRIIGFNQHV